MAGDFGYKNQKLANAIKNQSLNIRYIESLGGNIIARTGFSCAGVIKKNKI
jgi:adenosylmethionine-8-amino-7-oxononanoate aminotransferase